MAVKELICSVIFMKIFAVYSTLTILEQPTWLEDFKKRFHCPWDWHVTLKQPCFIEEEEVQIVKDRLADFVQQKQMLRQKLCFDEVYSSAEGTNHTIMLRMSHHPALHLFQKHLCEYLSDFTRYVSPEMKNYEEHFSPHVTIGETTTEEEYKDAMDYLSSEVRCVSVTDTLVLSVVSDMSFEATLEPNTKIHFPFF